MEDHLIIGKVDYVAEAVRLLSFTGSGNSYKELQGNYLKRNIKQSQAFEEKFYILNAMQTTLIRKLEERKADFAFYFQRSWDEGSNVGDMAILWDNVAKEPYEDLEQLRQELDAFAEEEYCKRFSRLLYSYSSLVVDESIQDVQDNRLGVIMQLMNMDVADDEKLKLQKVFLNPAEHREKMFAMLEEAMDVLMEYRPFLESWAKAFAAYWEPKLQGKCVVEYLQEQIGLALETNPLGCKVIPNVMGPTCISAHADSDKEGNLSTSYIFTFGIAFDDSFSISFATDSGCLSQEYCLKILKMLSDTSKFEILTYIKDKSAYGSELAKHLGLTTATISHHMSGLLSMGLVSIETKESKVYYTGNAKVIEEVLDYCKQVLA